MAAKANQTQALVVDLSGKPRHQLHVKLKEELGFAQVAVHHDLEESKRACLRFEGPTLVVFLLLGDKYSNYVRYYQRGATKPVEVAIVAPANASDSLRQEFLNLNVAAFLKTDDHLDAVKLAREILAEPHNFPPPPDGSTGSVSNMFDLQPLAVDEPHADRKGKDSPSDSRSGRSARSPRESSSKLAASSGESKRSPRESSSGRLGESPARRGASASRERATGAFRSLSAGQQPETERSTGAFRTLGPASSSSMESTGSFMDGSSPDMAAAKAAPPFRERPANNGGSRANLFAVGAAGVGIGGLLVGLAVAFWGPRGSSPPAAAPTPTPTPALSLSPGPTPETAPAAAPESTPAPTPAPTSDRPPRSGGAAFDPFAGVPLEPVEVPGAAEIAEGNVATIAEIRQFKSAWFGKVVAIEGVVSFGGGAFVPHRNQFHLQDGSGGLLIDDPDNAGRFMPATGDRVRVAGRVNEHRGMLQLNPESSTVPLGKAELVPVTLAPSRFDESYEGMLVRVENVTLEPGAIPPVPLRKNIEGRAAEGEPVELFLDTDTNIYGFQPPGPFALQGILYQWAPPDAPKNFRWIVYPRGREDFVF